MYLDDEFTLWDHFINFSFLIGAPVKPQCGNEVPPNVNLLEGAFEELKINNKGDASGFTASKCNVPINCGFSASFVVPFIRPKLVTDILNFTPSSKDIIHSSIVH